MTQVDTVSSGAQYPDRAKAPKLPADIPVDHVKPPKLPQAGHPGGGGNSPSPKTPTLTAGQMDAKAVIDGFLGQYGLQSLGDWAWKQFLNGMPVSEIMVDLRNRPEYKARFPAMDILAKKGRAMSEAEYVAYERQAAGIFHAAGLPPGFYDNPHDFAALIGNEVSVNELQQRVSTAYGAVQSAPQIVKDAFAKFYGPGSDNALAAYMLDPNKALPMIENQISAAKFSGIGSRFGFDLGQNQAETFGREGLSDQQMGAGFARADSLRGLEGANVGEAAAGSAQITEGQLLGSSFGTESDAAIQRRLKERTAAFSGGGGASSTQAGVSGLGGSQKG